MRESAAKKLSSSWLAMFAHSRLPAGPVHTLAACRLPQISATNRWPPPQPTNGAPAAAQHQPHDQDDDDDPVCAHWAERKQLLGPLAWSRPLLLTSIWPGWGWNGWTRGRGGETGPVYDRLDCPKHGAMLLLNAPGQANLLALHKILLFALPTCATCPLSRGH